MLKRNNKFCTRFNSVIKIEGKLSNKRCFKLRLEGFIALASNL
jgi:hypothetical protein